MRKRHVQHNSANPTIVGKITETGRFGKLHFRKYLNIMKGKFDNKLMATMLLLTLLAGTFGVATHLAPSTASEPVYKYLWIKYVPADMSPAPETTPLPPGEHALPYGWSGTITAPEMVNGTTDGVRYIFVKWIVYGNETGGVWEKPEGQLWADISMVENQTAVCYYKVQYKLDIVLPDVVEPYSDAYYQVYGQNWVKANSTWLDADTKVQVGFYPPGGGTGPWEILLEANKKAVFEKWVINGFESTSRESGWFFMDGPKEAVAIWKIQYFLRVKAAPPEPRPDLGGYLTPPSGEDWYDEQSEVTLTAPEFQAVSANWRLRFDYWDVDGERVEGNPITVHMDTNHTATAHYWLQYKLWVKTDPEGIVAIPGTGFYDTCTNVTLTAPQFVYFVDEVARYTFVKWVVGAGIGEFTTPTITFHVPHIIPTLPFEAVAVYKIQYYLTVTDNIGGASGLAAYSGWKEYWKGIDITAPDTVNIDGTSRWKFSYWIRSWDPTPVTTNRITFGMGSNATITAYYHKQYLAKWDATPVKPTGWPGQWWFDEGAHITYSAPMEVPGTTFVFFRWVINNVEYPVGQQSVPLTVTGPIDGVAYYVNKTAIYMSPTSVTMTAPATCKDFTIDVVGANFNKERGNMDIYAIDMKITFDPSLIEIKDVTLHLDDLWGAGKYFVAKSEWNNTAGWYWLVATALADTPGFEGTKTILTITFHVKYDPCYPETKGAWIFWNGWNDLQLVNHLNERIYPEYVYNSYYLISAPMPKLEIKPSSIQITSDAPTFNAEVWLNTGIKVCGYHVVVTYPTDLLDVLSVSISNFLPGPYATCSWIINDAAGTVTVDVVQQDGVPPVTGSGLLFTITFKVAKTAIWPDSLSGTIGFGAGTKISVLCPSLRDQVLGTDLGGVPATYSYKAKAGDVNLDGHVGLEDLRIIAMHYGETGQSYHPLDLNRNGKVDIFDLVLVAINYEKD